MISAALTVLCSVWLAYLTLPEPGRYVDEMGPTVYLRVLADPPHNFRIQIQQFVDATLMQADQEYFSIDLWDPVTKGTVPIKELELATSSRDSFMECIFGSESASPPDLRTIQASYNKVRPNLIGHYATKLVSAKKFTPSNPDSWLASCSAVTPIVDLKQATNVVTPTRFVVEIVGVSPSDLAIVEPTFSLIAPSSWVRADTNALVVHSVSESQDDSSYSPNLPYLVSPLDANYVFIDPARQRWIDTAMGLLLLVGGATVAVLLEWIAQRASQQNAPPLGSAERFRARLRRRARSSENHSR